MSGERKKFVGRGAGGGGRGAGTATVARGISLEKKRKFGQTRSKKFSLALTSTGKTERGKRRDVPEDHRELLRGGTETRRSVARKETDRYTHTYFFNCTHYN